VEALVGTYGNRVNRLALRSRATPRTPKVVQDALWTASRKIDTFRGRPPSAWVVRDHATRAYRSCGGGGAAARGVWTISAGLRWQGQHAEVGSTGRGGCTPRDRR